MSITRTPSFDPFRRAFSDMFDTMERDLLGPYVGTARYPSLRAPSSGGAITAHQGNYGMDLDFHETKQGYELSADLPGMRKEDITVDVDNETGILTVTGERKQEREEKGGGDGNDRTYHFVERSYGRTTRSIRLPQEADTSKADASYENGVLRLTFPKRDERTSKRLQIPIGDAKQPIENGKQG